jgi:general secretion pathway protein J
MAIPTRPAPLKTHQQTGFTLVEVLVAMMVMAILAAMAWQGVDSIVRARDASQIKMEQSLRLNAVLAQWEQDLASIQESPAATALSFDGISLRLIRRTDQGLQLVCWSLRPSDTPGQLNLLRWAGPITINSKDLQDTWLRSQQFVGTEPGQLRTLGGISQWQVYFYRGNGWSNAQSSGDVQAGKDSAPIAPRSEELPSGVRLVATFAEGSGLNGALTRDVALGPIWRP